MADTAADPEAISLCLAGVTGAVGTALAAAILSQNEFTLVSAVARGAAGLTVGEALGNDSRAPIRASVEQALAIDRFDVLIDYTPATSIYENVCQAVGAGVAVVVGGSGITAEQLDELDALAHDKGVGVIHGNFSLTATLAQLLAAQAARYFPSWEIIEYGHEAKRDAVSSTVRECAARLAEVAPSQRVIAAEDFDGDTRSRGATVHGTQVHAVRLPGMAFGFEVQFGKAHERLTIRHDTFDRAEPYIEGTLLAARRIGGLIGVRRGLDSILGDE